jgi:hypothetical protein
VTKDVEWDTVRVTGFAAHLAEVEAGDSDGMVDDDLVVIPTLVTAHGAIEILEVGTIIFRFPSFFFKDQLAYPDGERRRSYPPIMGRPVEKQLDGFCLRYAERHYEN